MLSNIGFIIVVAITSITIIICSIGIIIASRFQNKQKKKYTEVNQLINKNKGARFSVKEGLTKEEINNIDNSVNADILMSELYSKYVDMENKIKTFDTNFDDILTGHLKEFNISRIENFRSNGFADITDGIDLIGYTITEYSKEKLTFRVTINCFSYKTVNNQIVSGSNLEKIQKILLLTYENVNGKWLISTYNKIYERKLSD
ncbi:MAG: hypothetical protein IJE04_05235 [Bacilli bacterium]|nr:hypothetical protein [Bacilli bacterium]